MSKVLRLLQKVTFVQQISCHLSVVQLKEPGGTNTLTGVLGAWLDSIPMLIISGQIRYATTARAAGIPVRAMGDRDLILHRWFLI